MKKFSLLLMISIFSVSVFSQTAKSPDAKEIQANKAKFLFTFTLPDDISNEAVMKKEDFWKEDFTIEFSEETHDISLHLNKDKTIKDTGLSMVRYLMTLGIKSIIVEGTTMDIREFNKKYIFN